MIEEGPGTSLSSVLPPGYRLLSYDRVGSTNDEAKELAAQGAAHGTIVTALAQEAGRGRHGRLWVSPPGNLFASLIVRPLIPLAQAAQLGFVAALAVGDILTDLLADRAACGLKWPNDVLVDGAKISGILLESATLGQRLDWIVVGIGVNLVASPPDTPYPATHLGAFGVFPGREEVMAGLIWAFDRWYRRWTEGGFADLRAAWLGRAVGTERPLQIRIGAQSSGTGGSGETVLEGRFQDLDEDGSLLLATPDGVRRITAGDVYFGTR